MTSRLKDITKNRWNPEKKSSSSSSGGGGGIRGRVSGLVHRNGSNDAPTHNARPINELRDPASFAPPPKRTGTGPAPAPPPSTATRNVITAPSKYHDPRSGPVSPPEKNSHSQENLDYQVEQRRLRGEPEPEEDAAPRGPYRLNTTGLATDHLPPPPGRRDGVDGRSPPPSSYETATDRPALPPPAPARGATPGAASKPSLPPRLPPRTNTSSMTSPASPEPGIAGGSNNVLNKGAVNRLGAAGVSVPGLGIGKSGASSASPSPPPPHSRQPSAQVNELQNRFSNLKATNSEQDQQQAPAEGTTWAQKQAALKTASSFQKDPSSISMSDAKAAAGTANNFRQRHGEQVTSSMRSANSLNQKYGVANKIGGYAGGGQQQDQGQAGNPAAGGGAMSAVAGLAAKKKPPPPPPKKKPGLGGSATPTPTVVEDEPPPIPMATRPTF